MFLTASSRGPVTNFMGGFCGSSRSSAGAPRESGKHTQDALGFKTQKIDLLQQGSWEILQKDSKAGAHAAWAHRAKQTSNVSPACPCDVFANIRLTQELYTFICRIHSGKTARQVSYLHTSCACPFLSFCLIFSPGQRRKTPPPPSRAKF